jgi:hypothetical protein
MAIQREQGSSTQELKSIAEEFRQQDRILGILAETINDLETRIGWILQSSRPVCEENTKDVEPSCELASILKRNNRQLNQYIFHLKDIIERCEL